MDVNDSLIDLNPRISSSYFHEQSSWSKNISYDKIWLNFVKVNAVAAVLFKVQYGVSAAIAVRFSKPVCQENLMFYS